MKEEYFVDRSILSQHYPDKDYHDMYIGQIVAAYVAEE